jgi:protein O-mannosyl-transferase
LKRTSKKLLGLTVILAIAFGIYSVGLSGAFLFDDGPAITHNKFLTIDGYTFDEWRSASFSSDSGPLQRPFAMWSFAASQVVTETAVAWHFKLVNLFVHLACGYLVFIFARQVVQLGLPSKSPQALDSIALFCTALWLFSPLHVSTVLYAVQRMAQFSTLFVLVGLVLFMQQRQRWSIAGASAGQVLGTSLWLMLVLWMGLLSKENALLLLWLLPVLEVSLFRGMWSGRQNRLIRALGWCGLFAPLILTALILMLDPQILIGGYAGREFTVTERLQTQLRLLWQYLGWLIWPDINSMGFQHDDIPLSQGWLNPATTLLAGLGWLLALTLGYIFRARAPLLLFAMLFFLVAHFIESGIWPLEMVYEHRNYLPSVGVYILVSFVLYSLFECVKWIRPGIPVFAVLAAFATLLFLRVFAWSDAFRLSMVNVENHPGSARSHYFFAESLLQEYQRKRGSGENLEEATQYLVLARNEFELMHRQSPRDIAALIMLIYLDQHRFPSLQQYNDWFSTLEEVALVRHLQASDYTALEVLVDCFVERYCTLPADRLLSLLDALEHRYPSNARLSLLRYRYLKSLGEPYEARVGLLEVTRLSRPYEASTYSHLIQEYAQMRDIDALYTTIMRWLEHDPDRRYLTQIRRMFDQPPEVANACLDDERCL